MSIPKIIHYSWLSNDPYPEDIQECIDSWKEIMPDYEIKHWSLSNFDVNSNKYTKQAMECKKYAFVSDYIRLYALYTEGGIYLDSDVKSIKSFDSLLDNKAFIGFESGGRLGPWLIASEAGNPLIKELLDYYIDKDFIVDGEMDMTPNTVPVTNSLVDHGLLPDNVLQKLENITVCPECYFSPYNPWTKKTKVTEDTYAMHLFKGGWNDKNRSELDFIENIEQYLVEITTKDNAFNKKEIYIYGMGVVGRNVLDIISEVDSEISIKGIIVSKRDNGWMKLGDIPIIEVTEADKVDKDIPVLITVVPRLQDTIVSTLIKNGFTKYYRLGCE